jgi:hypothetical protein
MQQPVRASFLPICATTCFFTATLFLWPCAALGKSHLKHLLKEEKGVAFGAYAAPNEVRPETYSAVLESLADGGALISVGTFRALLDASMGSFDWVFMFDYDRESTEFNRTHLALLRAISELELSPRLQRFQYVAALNLYWLSADELRSLDVATKEPQDAVKERLTLLRTITQGIRTANAEAGEGLKARWVSVIPLFFGHATKQEEHRVWPPREMPALVSQLLSRLVLQKNHAAPKKSQVTTRNNFGGILLGGAVDEPPSRWKFRTPELRKARFYWEDNKAWLKLVALIQNERMVAVTGDLTGGVALKSISTALAKNNVMVRAIDVSNSISYFAAKRSGEAEKWMAFLANMNALPITEDAVILFSAKRSTGLARERFGVDMDADPVWSYFSASVTDFKVAAQALLKTGNAPNGLEKALLKNAIAASWLLADAMPH